MAPRIPRSFWMLALALMFALAPASRGDTPDPRIEAAVNQYREQGAEQALPVFQELAAEFAQASRTREEASALHYVGECFWRMGDFPEARRHLAD